MGTPKAWLSFDGETLLQRMVRLLGEVVEPIVVVAAAGQSLPTLPENVLLVRDAIPHRGPLQGLADGLTALRDWAEVAFVSSSDTPFLGPQFVARIIELLGADPLHPSDICVPKTDGRFHPLAAAYRLSILPAVLKLLAADRRRLQSLFDELPTRLVTAEELADVDPNLRSLRNLNTPEDYQTALRDAGGV